MGAAGEQVQGFNIRIQTVVVNWITSTPMIFMQLSPVYAIIRTFVLLNGRNCVFCLYAINQFYEITQDEEIQSAALMVF